MAVIPAKAGIQCALCDSRNGVMTCASESILGSEESEMSYWGSGPIDNDYAFGAVGVYVLLIKERMFQDAESVIEKSHPEQGIIASLQCLRASNKMD